MSTQNIKLTNDLLSAPLFQGMSRPDLQEIIGKFRLCTTEHKKGECLIKADTPCDRLIIILHGTVKITSRSMDNTYELSETLTSPLQFQIERLFGRYMAYTSTVYTITSCDTLCLSKHDILKLYNSYEVFRLNILNTLVMRLQKEEYRRWACSHHSLRRQIVNFITRHCMYPAGSKSLKITMNNLATELNDARINISVELNRLQKDNLIILHRGAIEIPALEKLYNDTAE